MCSIMNFYIYYVHVSNIGLIYNSLLKSGLSKVRCMLD